MYYFYTNIKVNSKKEKELTLKRKRNTCDSTKKGNGTLFEKNKKKTPDCPAFDKRGWNDLGVSLVSRIEERISGVWKSERVTRRRRHILRELASSSPSLFAYRLACVFPLFLEEVPQLINDQLILRFTKENVEKAPSASFFTSLRWENVLAFFQSRKWRSLF